MIFKKFWNFFRLQVEQLTWLSLIVAVIFHIVSTWIGLYWAGESALYGDDYFYYYVVTTSTVGYGDLSPSTLFGKIIVAVFQIPLGLVLFGAFVGKLAQVITNVLRLRMTGNKNYSSYESHIIIFGWTDSRTRKIIECILGDKNREQRRILLCVTDDIEHPAADIEYVDFARLQTFTDKADLNRIAIEHADKVIIDGQDDNDTFTTALRVSKLVSSDCHISAFFHDEVKAEMLREYAQNVECNTARIPELLVRSMQDPGASRIHEELLSTLTGQTQFSLQIPSGTLSNPIAFSKLFAAFKERYDVMLLGVAQTRTGVDMEINPPGSFKVENGAYLHYIAKERILNESVDWSVF